MASRAFLVAKEVIKSPWVTGGLNFLVHFRRRRSANTFQVSGENPEAYFFKPHMVNLLVWEKFWHPSGWPWVKVTKLPKQDRIYLGPTIKWVPLIQLLQNFVSIFPLSCFPPD